MQKKKQNLQEIKERYAKDVPDSVIDLLGESDHGMFRLMNNMSKTFTSNDCDPVKIRQWYKNRSPEQKAKYYKYKKVDPDKKKNRWDNHKKYTEQELLL